MTNPTSITQQDTFQAVQDEFNKALADWQNSPYQALSFASGARLANVTKTLAMSALERAGPGDGGHG